MGSFSSEPEWAKNPHGITLLSTHQALNSPQPAMAAAEPTRFAQDQMDWAAWRRSGIAGALTLLRSQDFTGDMDRTGLEAAIRARCQTVQVGSNTILCRILGAYKFLVDSRDEGLAPHLMLDGYWEFWVTDLIFRSLQPGQVAYDVGANLGYYAVIMADLVGPGGHVHAVEPNPRLSDLAARSLALNGFTGRSTMHRVVATDRTGATLRFRAAVNDPKNGRIVPDGTPLAPQDDQLVDVVVKGTRLDDISDQPADFVKIDVEGAEEAVWNGMQGLISRSPNITVLLEYNAGRCQDGGAFLRDIAARFPLRELGYDAVVRSVTSEEALDRREDTMLYLTNRF